MNNNADSTSIAMIDSARRAVNAEAKALKQLEDQIDGTLVDVLRIIESGPLAVCNRYTINVHSLYGRAPWDSWSSSSG